MFELTIHTKDGRELKRYELNGDRTIRIGRGLDCDIQISVPQVSRRHAELEPVGPDEWVLRDLNSTQGCFVAGERMRDELTITPGLEVQIGPALLRFDNMTARIGAELNALLADEDEGEVRIGDASAAGETLPANDGESVNAGKKKGLLGGLLGPLHKKKK